MANGVLVLVLPNAPSEDMFDEFGRLGITHVVIDRLELQPRRTERALTAIADHSCRFLLAFENTSFLVHRFLPACRDA